MSAALALALPGAALERRGTLGVLRSADPSAAADPALRARLLALAAAEGLTHLALELEDDAGTAPPLPRG